jgi:zinc D-Ala-D-Ala carboxypeptidase
MKKRKLNSSGYKMDKEFLLKLDYSRSIAGIPFKITSGFRTESRNQLVGGRVGSSHLKGLAVDIGYYGSRERYLILQSLISVGITRFGIAKGFIHCDVDKSKDPDVIWLY